MSPRRRNTTIELAQQADIDRRREGGEETDQGDELYPGGGVDDLRPLDVRLTGHLKRGTKLLLAGAALVGAVTTFVGALAKGWRVWRPNVGAAETPPQTDVATTAVDRVDHPVPSPPASRGGR